MRLPSFLVLGAPKCGTTSMHFWMAARPDVFVPAVKETHFLTKYGTRGLRWYATHFADAPDGAVVGEVASTYLGSPSAPLLAGAWLPGIRVIAFLRDPADRAWSHFWMQQAMWGGDDPPGPVLRRQMADPTDFEIPHEIYIEEGIYAPHLEAWADAVGRDSVCVLLTDELAADPEATYRRVCRHIGIDADPVPDVVGERFNETKPARHPALLRLMLKTRAWDRLPGRLGVQIDTWNRMDRVPPLPADLRKELVTFYEPHLDALEAWLGRPVPATWRRTD
ncbi:MAG: hypothetical protein JWO37_277 [Acidimicrobiales bacterium]|jgi:hypothetical protein|nr:hypothetical protein [Acidimicrobiales bacterium]